MGLYHDRFAEFVESVRAELIADDSLVAIRDALYASGDAKPKAADYMSLLPKGKAELIRARLHELIEINQARTSAPSRRHLGASQRASRRISAPSRRISAHLGASRRIPDSPRPTLRRLSPPPYPGRTNSQCT